MSEALNATLLTSLGSEVHEKSLAAVRESLDQATFTQAWEQGRAMSFDQLIEFVLHPSGSPAAARAEKERWGGLTAREREAALLIAGGKSNSEIARAMTVSMKTVESYVTRILRKLGFDSRVQIATWVIEKDLV